MPDTRLVRHLAPFLVLGAAMALFLIGLVAPLTPSEGNPRPIDIATYVVVPVVLCLIVAVRAARPWRWAGHAAGLSIAVATGWLFLAVL